MSSASSTAGIAAGNSETVAQPRANADEAPRRAVARGSVHADAHRRGEANTRHAAENAWAMKIVASVQIGVARPNVSAANSAPAELAPRSRHRPYSTRLPSAVNRPAVNTVDKYDSSASPAKVSGSSAEGVRGTAGRTRRWEPR